MTSKANTKKVVKRVDPWAGKERDKYGFIKGTKTAFIVAMLGAKKYTKMQILEELDNVYKGANNKITLAVLINDIQKPVGTYSASRGLTVKEKKKGVFSLS